MSDPTRESFLFIGGDSDGLRTTVPLPHRPLYRMKKMQPVPVGYVEQFFDLAFKKEAYRPERIGNRVVYIREEMSIGQVLDMLVDGYRR